MHEYELFNREVKFHPTIDGGIRVDLGDGHEVETDQISPEVCAVMSRDGLETKVGAVVDIGNTGGRPVHRVLTRACLGCAKLALCRTSGIVDPRPGMIARLPSID